MIGNFRVAMARATREREIIFSWRPFPADAPVRPDGFFSLQFPERPEGRNRAFFFLEADRSTMTRERFVQKLVSYWRWYRAGGHTEKLGIKGFRVLTVTKSEERLRSLLGATARTSELSGVLALFWFASEHRFGPELPGRIVEPIWTVAGEPDQVRCLLPIST
jgi:hypothetical protein